MDKSGVITSNSAVDKNTYPKFKALTSESVVTYIRAQPALQDLFKTYNPQVLEAQEIGDGNLNMVFRVSGYSENKAKFSVIVKQALPYLRLVGEGWPLTLDRARIEASAAQVYQKIAPERIPHLFYYDPDMCLTIMEDLKDYIILRKGLIAGKIYPRVGEHLGRFMARSMFFTSDFYLDPVQKKANVIQFTNPELCKITEELIFDEPYRPNVKNNQWNPLITGAVERLQSDSNRAVKEGVFRLRLSFMTHAEALIHGDLHTGSVMVTEHDTRVIDPEFAYYGPMGFDVGALIANLLLSFCSQPYHRQTPEQTGEYQAYLKKTALALWNTFISTWDELWQTHARPEWRMGPEIFKTHLARETLGFAGCKMVRRVVGLAHVADLESISNPEERAQAEEKALRMGQWLIANHSELERYNQFSQTLAQVFAME